MEVNAGKKNVSVGAKVEAYHAKWFRAGCRLTVQKEMLQPLCHEMTVPVDDRDDKYQKNRRKKQNIMHNHQTTWDKERIGAQGDNSAVISDSRWLFPRAQSAAPSIPLDKIPRIILTLFIRNER